MNYKVRFEIEFPWNETEAAAAEWLLVRRYGLQSVIANRLHIAIREATLEAVNREMAEAMKNAMQVANLTGRPPETGA